LVSNFLAVATVTAALKRILDEALASGSEGAVANATVTAVRPDAAGNGTDKRGVNIYLYQVTQNAGWRNADLPTRRPDGQLMQHPQAAIDLQYLFSFYGEEAVLEPQRLLGMAIRTLNAQPILTRDAIRAAIDKAVQEDPTTFLQFSDLVDQVELVKFSPIPLNLEELSKLWSVFFQTPYVLSVAYQGTVVLIESEETPQEALPVRDRSIYVVPFRFPVIDRVQSDAGPTQPITSGSTLVILGQQLRGDITRVRVGPVEVIPNMDEMSDTRITIAIPSGVPAGVEGVQVVQRLLMGTPPEEHRGFESNVAPFVLRPTITGLVTATPAAGIVNVNVPMDPPVGKGQRVILLLNEFDPPTDRSAHAYSFSAPSRNQPAAPDTVTSIEFPTGGVAPGSYLVRVQVDGAESLLETDPNGKYVSPRVTFA
jgi:hypothetical protein